MAHPHLVLLSVYLYMVGSFVSGCYLFEWLAGRNPPKTQLGRVLGYINIFAWPIFMPLVVLFAVAVVVLIGVAAVFDSLRVWRRSPR